MFHKTARQNWDNSQNAPNWKSCDDEKIRDDFLLNLKATARLLIQEYVLFLLNFVWILSIDSSHFLWLNIWSTWSEHGQKFAHFFQKRSPNRGYRLHYQQSFKQNWIHVDIISIWERAISRKYVIREKSPPPNPML